MASLATHVGTWVLSDRLIASQEHRPRRHQMAKQAGDQHASQRPGRPPALGEPPRRGSHRPRGTRTNGALPRGQHGRERPHQKSVSRWGGQRGPKHAEYRHRTRGDSHGCGPSSTTVVIMPLIAQPMPHVAYSGSTARWSGANDATATRPGCGGPSAAPPGPGARGAGESPERSAALQATPGFEGCQAAPRLGNRQTFF